MPEIAVKLPEHTLEWLREFGREASLASDDAELVAELVRMTEREQRVRAGTWDQTREQEFLAHQRGLGQ